MHENAFRVYSVPKLQKSNTFVNVLTNDEKNYLTLGCVRSFARAKFSVDKDDIATNMADYRLQVDELRKAVDE